MSAAPPRPDFACRSPRAAFERGAMVVLAAALAATPAGAWTPAAPEGASLIAEQNDPAAPYGVAIGPARPLEAPLLLALEGPRQRLSYRAPPDPAAALRLLDNLRGQLLAAGYTVVYSCAASTCGGFDFRRAQPVLPMPAMYVDLGNFSYVAARKDGPGGDADPPVAVASLLASQSATAAYAQITLVSDLPLPAATAPGPKPRAPGTPLSAAAAPDLSVSGAGSGADPGTAAPAASGAAEPPPPIDGDWTAADVAAALAANGRVVLEGTEFATGSTRILGGPSTRVRAVAAWLKADPRRRVAVVGHSDWTGSVEANLKVSRARAAAVAAELTGELGVPAAQIRIDGVGPLAPRAANADATGLQANRRVEVVALPDAG